MDFFQSLEKVFRVVLPADGHHDDCGLTFRCQSEWCNILPQIIFGDNRSGDWPGPGLPAWRPTRRLARKSLAGIPKTGGDTGEPLARNSLHCCPGSGSENPVIPEPKNPKIRENRRAICLLEPLIPTPWGSSGSPEWGSWSQYQKDSGGDRK